MFNENIKIENLLRNVANSYADIYGETISLSKLKGLFKIIFDNIIEEVRQGKRVTVRDFGSFASYVYNEREGVNPVNGESFTVPKHLVPTFRAGRKFKRAVANNLDFFGDEQAEEIEENTDMYVEVVEDVVDQ